MPLKDDTVLEFIISYDSDHWIARGEGLIARAPTLAKLDDELKEQLKERGCLAPGEKRVLFMAFDNSTIPAWMRQYSQHYFNRILQVGD